MRAPLEKLFPAALAAVLLAAVLGPLLFLAAVGIERRLPPEFSGFAAQPRSELPSGLQLAGAPLISADGRRMLLKAGRSTPEKNPGHSEQDSAGEELWLWEEALGFSVLPLDNDLTVYAYAADSGLSRAVLLAGKHSGDRASGGRSLYLWEEGFPIRPLRAAELQGEWQLNMSGDGRRIVLFPAGGATGAGPAKRAPFVLTEEEAEGRFAGRFTFPPRFREETLFAPPVCLSALAVNDLRVSAVGSAGSQELQDCTGIREQLLQAAAPPGADDFDGRPGADLLTFEQSPALPFWRLYSLDRGDGPLPKTAGASGAVYTWRIGSGAGIPVPGDYNGDGAVDLATFSLHAQGSGQTVWEIYYSRHETSAPNRFAHAGMEPQHSLSVNWGSEDSVPVPGDYDGDLRTDIAVFEPQSGVWRILYAAGGFHAAQALLGDARYGLMLQWGLPGDLPQPADYNGDGCTDPAVVRGEHEKLRWLVRPRPCRDAAPGAPIDQTFGAAGDIPLAADYDGDGRAEMAVFSLVSGRWEISFGAEEAHVEWAVGNGEPFALDFDGDKKADPAFYSPSQDRKFHILPSRISPAVRRIHRGQPPASVQIRWGGPGAKPPVLWQRCYAEAAAARAANKRLEEHPEP